VEKINETMYDFTSGQFLTLCYACIDVGKRKLLQASAGHWPLLLVRKGQESVLFHDENGMPIGWLPDCSYGTMEDDLQPGDRLVFYTDGLVETRNGDGDIYGRERFQEFVMKGSSLDAEGLSEGLMQSVMEGAGIRPDRGFEDDVTLIVIDLHPDITPRDPLRRAVRKKA